jgi:hypothetical protein
VLWGSFPAFAIALGLLSQIVDQLTGLCCRLTVVHRHDELALAGLHDHGLPVHAAYHVEGCTWLAAQRELLDILLNAVLDDLAQLVLHLEEAVCRAKPSDALMRTLEVVPADPVRHAFPCGIKTLELRTAQEFGPDRLPEPFYLPERLGMMWP